VSGSGECVTCETDRFTIDVKVDDCDLIENVVDHTFELGVNSSVAKATEKNPWLLGRCLGAFFLTQVEGRRDRCPG
jgi:hypothetical protein